MYQYRQALLRMRQGDSDRQIARDGLMGRAKCKALREQAVPLDWLKMSTPLPDDDALAAVINAKPKPAPCVSTLEPYRAEIERWIGEGLQGTTIYAALQRKHGFLGSYSAVRRFVQAHTAKQPVATTMRLDFAPGDAAQVDFGSGPPIADPRTGELKKTWIFVMTLCWSRHQYAEIVLDQSTATWLGCHRRAFEWFGGVPGRIIIDNPKCAITRACHTDPTVQRAYAECAEGYGFKISPCPPRDPQKKRDWWTSMYWASPAWRGDSPAIGIRVVRLSVESAVRVCQRRRRRSRFGLQRYARCAAARDGGLDDCSPNGLRERNSAPRPPIGGCVDDRAGVGVGQNAIARQ